MQLLIKSLNGGVLALDVSGAETIEELKQMIEQREGIPSSQLRLFHATRLLSDDDVTVSDSLLQHSDVLEVSLVLHGGLTLIVKSIKGENYSIDVEPSETVSSLKQKIRDLSAATPGVSEDDELVLTFRGKKLDDDNTLNALKDNSALMLVRKRVQRAEPAVSSSPVLCLNNCGFFGSSASRGYCSKCFKDLKLDEAEEVPKTTTPTTTDTSSSSSSSSSIPVPETDVVEKPVQADKTRCWKCTIKVGLLGYPCKCEYVFCAKHRYSDKHECTFDYEGSAKERLGKELTTTKQNKVDTL